MCTRTCVCVCVWGGCVGVCGFWVVGWGGGRGGESKSSAPFPKVIHVFALTYVCIVYIYSLCLQKDGILTAEMVSSGMSDLEHSGTGLKHTYHCLSLPVRYFHRYIGTLLKCITLTLQHVCIAALHHVAAFYSRVCLCI